MEDKSPPKLNMLSTGELIKLVKEEQAEIWKMHNKINRLKENIKEKKQILYKKCNHEWVWDGEIPGPYDKMEKICNCCGLYKDNSYN